MGYPCSHCEAEYDDLMNLYNHLANHYIISNQNNTKVVTK